MELKGSRTEQNLMAAFSGESMARNKYLFFAEKAKQEGNTEVAELFEQMAQNEGIHGKLLYQRLKGVGSSSANLQDAIQGEYGEWSSMYPSFADIAREEGFEAIGTLFDQIAKIEKVHAERFRRFAQLLEQGKLFVSDVDTAWICLNCGHIHRGKQAPAKCPVCQHSQGYFIRLELSPYEK